MMARRVSASLLFEEMERIEGVTAEGPADVCRWLRRHPIDVYHLPWLDRSAAHYDPLLAAPRAFR